MAWNLIADLDFSGESNTVVGAAGTTTGAGSSGLLKDLHGGVWNINGGFLIGDPDAVDIDTQIRDFLAFPDVFKHVDQRIIVDFPAGTDVANVISVALRFDPATRNNYRWIFTRQYTGVFGYAVVSDVGTGWSGGGEFANVAGLYDPTHTNQLEITAVGVSPTVLTATMRDTTTNTVIGTATRTDSTSALQVPGGYAINIASTGADTVTTPYARIRIYSQATLGASPLTLPVSTSGNAVTLSGADTNWTVGTPGAPTFTVSGVAGVSVTAQTVNSATSATLTVNTGATAGTANYADSSSGTTAAQSIVSGTTIAVTNANFRAARSPYNWYEGSGYIRANNFGAYIRRLPFTGTYLAITVDVSAEIANGMISAGYPFLAYSIDNGAIQLTQLTSASGTVVLASGLPDATHELTALYFYSGHGGTDRWNAQAGRLEITSIVVDSGRTINAPTLRPYRLAIFGDSLAETAVVDSIGHGDGRYPYPVAVADALDCEYGICAFGGSSFDATSGASVPRLIDSFPYYANALSRLTSGALAPSPDYVLVHCGHNGTPTSALVTSFLTAIRAAAPTSNIALVVPLSQLHASAITTGYNNYQVSAPDSKLKLINLGAVAAYGLDSPGTPSLVSYDGLHTDIPTSGRIGAAVAREWQRQIDASTSGGRRRVL